MHRGPERGPAQLQRGRLTVAELLQRESGIEQPVAVGRSGDISRVLASAAGVALVCAVIIASTAALIAPRVERALPAPGAVENITGAGVLRPALIDTTIDPAPVEQPSHTPPEAGDTSDSSPAAPVAPAAPEVTGTRESTGRSLPPDDARDLGGGVSGNGEPADGETPTSEQTEPTAGPSPDELLRTVTSFYQQVVTAPADAYALLGPVMRGSGYQPFAESWRDVEQVTVESIRRDGHDAAIVTVMMERADGSVLRSVQRVVVTGDPPRIESARLLSASAS